MKADPRRVGVVAHDRAAPRRMPIPAVMSDTPLSSAEAPIPADATAPPMPSTPMGGPPMMGAGDMGPPARAPASFRPHNQRKTFA